MSESILDLVKHLNSIGIELKIFGNRIRIKGRSDQVDLVKEKVRLAKNELMEIKQIEP